MSEPRYQVSGGGELEADAAAEGGRCGSVRLGWFFIGEQEVGTVGELFAEEGDGGAVAGDVAGFGGPALVGFGTAEGSVHEGGDGGEVGFGGGSEREGHAGSV